ncbi:hypothetical protein [Lactobacillus johnsonii]|uniref:Uncharacterized protein n=1 Tax=Lactobacillus johnsonii TaxID=33959 RepID=A0A9X7T610_LACJH|nr:hypothetical protein [Lactobacillus johnsonii]QIA88559.1 hypothetical protein FEE39_09970 [Lactobacillus johnsonii]QIA88588.1 hypothetical protein FEE39_10115 [Lactobacillus johnsonii]
MEQGFINTNEHAQNDILCTTGLYKNRKLFIKQVKFKDGWLCGYVELLPTDTIYQKIKKGTLNSLDDFFIIGKDITFLGNLVIENEKLDSIFIGIDYSEPFLRNTGVKECLGELKEIADEIEKMD